MTDKLIVLVTCRSIKEAERIARTLVERRLAACGNILRSPVRSIYRWKEKIESAREVLLVLKTSSRRFPALQAAIKRLHSYEVPEIIALPITVGSDNYLSWLAESVAPRKKR
ncbi:MAG TPA: divalent-cation tolerance protein CutA [Candidatus Acidoferrum sp.]|jgi:periplasmic divalent cation tolerance protein